MTAVLAVNADNLDHGRLVAGLEALQRAVDAVRMDDRYVDGDAIDYRSLVQRIAQIFTAAITEANED